MRLTPNQISELYKVIHLYIYGFIAENVGSDMLVDNEIKLLQESGVDLSKLQGKSMVETAFKFGVISTMLPESQLKALKYSELKKLMYTDLKIPLNKVEIFALDNVKRRAYTDIKGLGNRYEAHLNNILIEDSHQKRTDYEKVIRDTAEEAILKRESISQLRSNLGHKTGDWSRDFGRIADFIMHDAYDKGRCESYRQEYGDDVEVYRAVYKGACKHCIKLQLTAGIGSEPILFKLSDLEANGTNIGRKQDDWKAVEGSVHPFCRCTTHVKPAGYIWNPKDQAYTTVDPNWKPKVKWKSKVPIQVG